jgi:chloramphenicol 3-O-phosphotransferase
MKKGGTLNRPGRIVLHQGVTYDLEIDTNLADPMACARLIKKRFRL